MRFHQVGALFSNSSLRRKVNTSFGGGATPLAQARSLPANIADLRAGHSMQIQSQKWRIYGGDVPTMLGKIEVYTTTNVSKIIAMAVTQATMLNVSVLTYSPIKSRRFTSSKIKISTTGSQTPLPTCEKIKIFHNGAFGSRTIPAPTAIRIV
jgi:hypothetical protein